VTRLALAFPCFRVFQQEIRGYSVRVCKGYVSYARYDSLVRGSSVGHSEVAVKKHYAHYCHA